MTISGVRRLRVLARVMPTWKFLCAIGFFCFAVLGALALPFTGIGFPATITYTGLALIPVLYLLAVDRKHSRATEQPHLGRNPIPLGILIAITLTFGGAFLGDQREPSRDPGTVMPNLVGMELSHAKDLLRDLELDTATHDDTGEQRYVWVDSNWTVTSQTPSAGTTLADLDKAVLGVIKTGETLRAGAAVTTDLPTVAPTTTPPTFSTTPTSTAATEQSLPTPPHNACLLIDPDALTAAHMSDELEQPLTDHATPNSNATYACGNDLSEVAIEITLHPNEQDAAASAEYATRPEILTDPYTPFTHATRIPLRTGAKVIATNTGVSRISWSHGLYSILLEINSDPVVPGLTPRHPDPTIDRLAEAIIDRTDQALTHNTW
ncbi:PASTA domain-containing protein [Nocardia sp. NPDC003963]